MIACPSCGRTLADDMVFCPYCGTKMISAAREQERPEDRVMDVLPLATPEDARNDARTLVLTRYRLIIAALTERDREFIRRMTLDGSKARGKAFYGLWESAAKPKYSYARRFLDMTPETVLAETLGNTSIDFDRIRSVKVAASADAEGNQIYVLTIDTGQAPLRFSIGMEREFRDVLMERFGPKLHW